eukprot:UN04922
MFRKMKFEKKYKYGVPHKQRLCIIVDRRNDDMELFMYKPNKLADFPKDYVKEWYFESSNKCVLPGKSQNDTISSKSNGDGTVFYLSFHCEQ